MIIALQLDAASRVEVIGDHQLRFDIDGGTVGDLGLRRAERPRGVTVNPHAELAARVTVRLEIPLMS